MEARFGADFGSVRIHTGPEAATASRAVDAKAYAIGNDIVFGDRGYDPSTRRGKWLIAHELTHVVQQRRGGPTGPLDPNAPHESEARQAASAILAGEPTVNVLAGTALGVARATDEDADEIEGEEEGERDPRNRTEERGKVILKTFAERAHDTQAAELAEEKLRRRSRKSEEARHKTRDARVHEHHGFPKFLGGLEEQTKIMLREDDHQTYHRTLYELLEKEFKRLRPGEQPSRRYYGPFFARLSKKEQEQVFRAMKEHAKEFDRVFHGEYLDRRTRISAALRRGIREAKQEAKQEEAKKIGASISAATKPITGTTKKPPGGGSEPGGTSKSAVVRAPSATPVEGAKGPTKPPRPAVAEEVNETEEKRAGTPRPVVPRPGRPTKKAETEVEAADVVPVQQVKEPEGHKTAEPVKTAPLPKAAQSAKTSEANETLVEETKKTPIAQPSPVPNVATPPAPSIKKPAEATQSAPAEQPKIPVSKIPPTEAKEPSQPPSKPAPPKPTAPIPAPPKPTPPVVQQETKVAAGPSPVVLPPKPPASATKAAKPETSATATTATPPQTSPPAVTAKAEAKAQTTSPQPEQSSSKAAPEKKPESEKSSSREVSHGASLIAGPDRIGASGTVGAGATQKHGQGLETTQSVHFGGKIVLNSEEIPNTSPKRFRVTLTIDLSGEASLGASRGGEGRVGGSLSASASGVLKKSFTHELTAEQSKKYTDAVNQGTGGAQQDLELARMIKDGSIEEAKAYLTGKKSDADTPEALKKLAEGDVITTSAGGTAEAKGGLSAFGAGAEFGVSRSGELTRTKAVRDGKILLTVTVVSGKGTTVGGSFSEGVASVGVSREGKETKSKSVTFILDPKDAKFNELSKEVLAADTVDDLSKLAAKRPELTGSTTTGHTTGSGLTTSASAAGLGFSVKEAGEYGEETTAGPHGVTHKYEGSGTLGGSLTVAGKTVAKSSQTDKFAGQVGPDNKATGETSSTQTETDYLATIQEAAKHPLGTAGALATGGAPVLKEKSEVQGKELTDDSYARLAELAKDPAAWEHSWSGSVSTMVDWQKTRRKVLAANGDRNQIAKALAQFESEGSGRSRTVENAVSDTGIAFDFPEEVKDQKPVYDELVVGDPFAHPRELAQAGKRDEAIAELNSVNEKLGKLIKSLQSHQEQVQNAAALAEMMRRISDRRTKLRAEIRNLSPQPKEKPAPSSSDGKGKGQATQEDPEKEAKAREEAAKREERNAKINDLVPTLLTNREKERTNFNAVYEELKKESAWFSKPDVIEIAHKLNALKPLYEQWDKSVAQLKELFIERGEANPDRANGYGPNRTEWNALHKRVFIW
jgi:hypothetical protein